MPSKMNNEEYGILSDDDSTYDDKEKKTVSVSRSDSSDTETEEATKKGAGEILFLKKNNKK